jgi:acyl-CoA dehydrogenase
MTIRLNPLPWMTEEVAMLREAVRDFIAGEISPHLEQWRQRGWAGREIWRKMGDLGMLLPEMPEAYGGAGGTFAHQYVIQEELAWAESPPNVSVHAIAAHYILDHGTEAQKQRWLPRLASGELLGAIVMTEPGGGSDLQAIRTRAVREGDEYVVNGVKTFITGGSTANLLMLAVKTDPSAGAHGISMLVVETDGLAGYRVGRLLEKVGMKSSDTAELYFDDVRVPADGLLGGSEGHGFVQMMEQLPFERLLIAVAAQAATERAIELTVAHTKAREAFGGTLYDLQNTRFTLAECATVAHVTRTFLNDCVQRLLDGRLDPEVAYMTKWWCTEQQSRVLDACVQLFGGYGYMLEYPIARLWADARVGKVYGGSNEIMKELIARAL